MVMPAFQEKERLKKITYVAINHTERYADPEEESQSGILGRTNLSLRL